MRTIIINARALCRAAALAVAGLLPAVGAGSGATHDYTIAVDAGLERLLVEARLAMPSREIAARSRHAERFIRDVRDCDTGAQLGTRGRRLVVPDAGIRCLSYAFDLRSAARTERLNRHLTADNIVVSPTLWMWRPVLRDATEIRIRFALPDNVAVSVPWSPLPNAANAYRLTASPESGAALAVFGQFDSQTVSAAGAEINVTLLQTARELDAGAMGDWIRDTAANIALAYGRFPNPYARVVLIPVGGGSWGGNSPVPFGRVVRDGGETIELLINEQRPVAEYYGEWEPTHEFAHLMLPYLRRSQRWIAEGFATYYQNLLLARAGRYSETEAWQKLYSGLERGRESAPGLSPNAAAAGDERSTRMKIYWSGVALALMVDVELRRRSGGSESLDTVLDKLQACCLPSNRAWSGRELFRQLDALLDEPIFMDLYRKYADTAGFPDARPLLRQLGVIADAGTVRIADAAELAGIRRGMTAAPAPSAAGVAGR
ncbi:MAG: hypothetical protein OEO82_03085 [Gammaproteobacteria bacterium]|nr:hypothetical protein [Gammaproteobacteria bacterium]